MINKKDIIYYLDKKNKDCDIYIYDTVKSTNSLAREFISDGSEDKTIIIANHQSNGRGRQGKTFFSPAGTGIYMSIILDFREMKSKLSLVTSYAAIALCRAIEQVCTLQPKIKWVNDIYINNKKVSGILTETVGFSDKIIIGIGINVSTKPEDFPDELKNTAASLGNNTISKNNLIAAVVNEVLKLKHIHDDFDIHEIYKGYSLMMGRKIKFVKNTINILGTVVDIDKNINLIVKDNTENIYTLSSGEIILLDN